MKKRLAYPAATLLLLLAEVLIALFLRDRFIRPYGGDVLVVILLYCLIRSFRPEGWRWLPLGVFLFAVAVELLQAVSILSLLGLDHIGFLRIAAGTSFSFVDIGCYAAGCLLCAVGQEYRIRKHKVAVRP